MELESEREVRLMGRLSMLKILKERRMLKSKLEKKKSLGRGGVE